MEDSLTYSFAIMAILMTLYLTLVLYGGDLAPIYFILVTRKDVLAPILPVPSSVGSEFMIVLFDLLIYVDRYFHMSLVRHTWFYLVPSMHCEMENSDAI